MTGERGEGGRHTSRVNPGGNPSTCTGGGGVGIPLWEERMNEGAKSGLSVGRRVRGLLTPWG